MSDADLLLPLYLPCRVTPLDAASNHRQWDAHNLALLQGLTLLGELNLPEAPLDPQLTRLEGKLDLAVLLLGEVLRVRGEVPPAQHLSLNLHTVQLAAQPELQPEQPVLIELYLAPTLPLPVKLSGKLQQQDASQMRIALDTLPDEVDDRLGQALFRFHRAQLRQRS